MARIVITEAELFLAMRGHTAANQVHDELIYHIPEATAAKFAVVLNKVMSRDVPWMPNLPVAAKVKIGDNYGECK
jgi:DNA polymerase I-like protein with 3'-5' exonuclease and polymerase domains